MMQGLRYKGNFCATPNPSQKIMTCGGEAKIPKIMWPQFPPKLKKNPPQNYVATVPCESQKESEIVQNKVLKQEETQNKT
jgi:hypothetical protein